VIELSVAVQHSRRLVLTARGSVNHHWFEKGIWVALYLLESETDCEWFAAEPLR